MDNNRLNPFDPNSVKVALKNIKDLLTPPEIMQRIMIHGCGNNNYDSKIIINSQTCYNCGVVPSGEVRVGVP